MCQKTKIGIIGCGTIGSVHAEAYAKVPKAEVVALCDILPDRLKEKAERHNVGKTYEDYNDLLADPEIEAVSICVPNNMHAPIAIAALKAGKHVMLEKPMTINQKFAKDIIKARDESGKLLQMGMVYRQNPEAQAVKQQIEAGMLGEIYQIRVRLIRRRGIPGLGGWFTTKECSGGGGLIDIAVHFLDLVMWETGYWDPTRVSAKVYSKFGNPIEDYHYISMWAGPPKMDGTFNVDDYAAGFIRFGKKATLSFEVAWACNAENEMYAEILGDKGGVKNGCKLRQNHHLHRSQRQDLQHRLHVQYGKRWLQSPADQIRRCRPGQRRNRRHRRTGFDSDARSGCHLQIQRSGSGSGNLTPRLNRIYNGLRQKLRSVFFCSGT
ncbi:MAG: Gfo/Idh/MocA family oxidoreductase [Lentisphaeria bacterium]|nr:Gfo/Idh/MocA family oxidoreductase [Lentisphaeria bacterium]